MIFPSNPHASYLVHKQDIDDAIHHVLDGDRYILGMACADFEKAFLRWTTCEFGLGVANGTDAIEIALRAFGVGPGDEVITVSHTAVATISAIERANAKPILVDIDPISYTMDIASFKQAITNKTRAVIPVHLYGHPAKITEIVDIAHEHGFKVIEDCAQAHGAKVGNKRVGTFGDVATFSFYPTKNLGAIGDAGFITTNDEKIAQRMTKIRQYGWGDSPISEIKGVNSRLDELQAAILLAKMPYLDEDIARRQAHSKAYSTSLVNLPVSLPVVQNEVDHAFHLYVIRCHNRDEVLQFLHNDGVLCGIHYRMAVHQQPAYAEQFKFTYLPITEQAVDQILSLPLYPELTEADREHVVASLIKAHEVGILQ